MRNSFLLHLLRLLLLLAGAIWSANAARLPRAADSNPTPTNSGPTSWVAGKCTPSTTTAPGITCPGVSRTKTAHPVTVCGCPDGKLYSELGEGYTAPCAAYTGTQDDWAITVTTECPSTTTTKTRTTTAAPTRSASVSRSISREQSSEISAHITVSDLPAIFTANEYLYTTTTAVPTGHVLIHPAKGGWGPEGSVWNFTTGHDAKLVNMTAKCQGSDCNNAASDPLKDGKMKQRGDGSWYLNVTKDMQNTVIVDVILLDKSGPSKRSLHRPFVARAEEEEFDFIVRGLPPSDMPMAANCSSEDFEANPTQWEAYQVDKFMKDYISGKKLKSLDGFRKSAMDDFIPEQDTKDNICDITNGIYDCDAPGWAYCGLNSDDTDLARGTIMTTGAVIFTKFMASIYDAMEEVRGRIGDYMDSIVTTWFVPAADQRWEEIMGFLGSVLGFITSALIFITAFFPANAILGSSAIAASVALTTSINTALNGQKLVDPNSEDTRVEKAGEYRSGAQNMLRLLQKGLVETYTADVIDEGGLQGIFEGGMWVSDSVSNALNDQGFSASITNWYEKAMVANWINQALTDNNAYIQFVPYKDTRYAGTKWEMSKLTCENHFINNPRWEYYAHCSIPLGPGGVEGMALLRRPSDEGSESWEWANTPLEYAGHNITAFDIVSSSVQGFATHGYGYSLLNQDFTELVKGGEESIKYFTDMPWDEPGLYRLPVCVTEDLENVAGIGQIMFDIKEVGREVDYPQHADPCACKDFTHEADGKTQKFVDFVSDTIKNSVVEERCDNGGRGNEDAPTEYCLHEGDKYCD